MDVRYGYIIPTKNLSSMYFKTAALFSSSFHVIGCTEVENWRMIVKYIYFPWYLLLVTIPMPRLQLCQSRLEEDHTVSAVLGEVGRASAAPGGSQVRGSCSQSGSPRSPPPLARMEVSLLREVVEVVLLLLSWLMEVEVVEMLDHQHRCRHSHQNSRGRY